MPEGPSLEVRSPILPPGLEPWRGKPADVRRGWTATSVGIEGADFAGIDAGKIQLNQVALERVNLTEARLPFCQTLDVTFKKCEGAGVSFEEASFERTAAIGCRMSGANFAMAKLEHVTFQECRFDLSNFRGCEISWVRFVECDLREADFAACRMNHVWFERCELTQADYDRCEMKEVDFRSSDLSELKSASGLGGAIIDPVQLLGLAPKLASLLHIRVRT